MPTTSANQGIRVLLTSDDPNIPDDVNTIAAALELRVVGTYTSVSDRSSRVPSPIQGMVSILKDSNTLQIYSGSTWLTVYPPPVPSITSGTSVPSNGTGANGDVFFKV